MYTIKVVKPDGQVEQFQSTRDYKFAVAVKCAPGDYWYDELGHLWHIVKHSTKKHLAEKDQRYWSKRYETVVLEVE